MKTFIAAICAGIIFTMAVMVSAEPLASVVTVRGKASVARGTKKLDAQPKLGIELQDTVATAEGGRVKMLFIDDSVLTLAEKSSMSINTFVHSRSDRGDSLFNLLDGKMRAVVGKTRFEVKTPTVVAAARGTVILFDVSTVNGKSFTRVTCLEGIVDVRLLTAAPGTKPILLSPGQSLVVTAQLPATAQNTTVSEQKSTPSDQKPTAAETQNVAVIVAPVINVTEGTSGVTAKVVTEEPQAEINKVKLAPPEVKLELPTPAEISVMKSATNISGGEIKLPALPTVAPVPPRVILPPLAVPVIPVIPQQPAKTQPTRVDIGVRF